MLFCTKELDSKKLRCHALSARESCGSTIASGCGRRDAGAIAIAGVMAAWADARKARSARMRDCMDAKEQGTFR